MALNAKFLKNIFNRKCPKYVDIHLFHKIMIAPRLVKAQYLGGVTERVGIDNFI